MLTKWTETEMVLQYNAIYIRFSRIL